MVWPTLGSKTAKEQNPLTSTAILTILTLTEIILTQSHISDRGGAEFSRRCRVTNSLRQTVHTHRASVHQAAKLVAALLRVAGVTAGLAESNGSLPPGL